MKILVVEDDRKIKNEVIDEVLASLGYENDWATNQLQAVEFLGRDGYDLVLLDLQIPARPGSSAASSEFGKHLLRQIRDIKGHGNVPVVIMTGHHQDGFDMVTDLIGMGAIEFISKPFPPNGRTLASVIEMTLQKYQKSQESQPPKPEGTFTGGEMVFYPNHIELCGFKILGSKAAASREMLKVLTETKSNGIYKNWGGEQIADKISAENGIGTITGCARTIRTRVAGTLKKHMNVEMGENDFLEHSDQGYRLNHRITVRFCDSKEILLGQNKNLRGQNSVPKGHLRGQKNDPINLGVSYRVKTRCQWILDTLNQGRKLRREDVESSLKCSDKTAQRALDVLRNADIIKFQGSKKTGYYVLTKTGDLR
ncbi:MAG TPA: response regulator [Anaerohalosphaeraceae bacterium]|nr:response regulator [Anaerohalosphaeraceae bacterium]